MKKVARINLIREARALSKTLQSKMDRTMGETDRSEQDR